MWLRYRPSPAATADDAPFLTVIIPAYNEGRMVEKSILKSERSWEWIYGVLYAHFSFLTLLWIFPYAALTMRARSWMTR